MAAGMSEPQLARLFSEGLDRLDYAIMDARLWLIDLIYGPEPATPAGEKREAAHNGLEALPIMDFGAFMDGAAQPPGTDVDRG
jgi:hypothetical protein